MCSVRIARLLGEAPTRTGESRRDRATGREPEAGTQESSLCASERIRRAKTFHGLLRTLIAFQMLRNVEKRRFEAVPSPSNVGVSRAQNINYGNFPDGIDLRKSN